MECPECHALIDHVDIEENAFKVGHLKPGTNQIELVDDYPSEGTVIKCQKCESDITEHVKQ